jgi:hypothetical protein
MSSCAVCLKYTGNTVIHDDGGCALAASILCRRCHHRGHLTTTCTYGVKHWERPTTLEELIPSDLRARYGITTSTRVEFTAPRCTPEAEGEIAPVNTIVIPDDYTQLNEFAKKHKIVVPNMKKKPAEAAILTAIKDWAIHRGIRIVVSVPKKTTA